MDRIKDIIDIYRQADYAGVLEHRRKVLLKRRLVLQTTNEMVPACISDDRWVAMCPWCDGGIGLLPGNEEAVCLGCGRVYRAEFPPAQETIKALDILLKYPPRLHNWFPQLGQKAADLPALMHLSWVTPRVWVVGEIVTAAMMNQDVRDNMLETGPAKVTTAGDTVYATAINALARLGIGAAYKILWSNGSAPGWTGLAGGLVVVASVHATADQSTTSSTPSDLTGMSVNITPLATSTILIFATMDVRCPAPGDGGTLLLARLVYDGAVQGDEKGLQGLGGGNATQASLTWFRHISGASTAAKTVKIQWRSEINGKTVIFYSGEIICMAIPE